MDLTNEDVQDILRVLDGLPFGELNLETARFRLSLRRSADGQWTQDLEVLTAPNLLPGEDGAVQLVDGPMVEEPAVAKPAAETPAGEAAAAEAERPVGEDLADVRAPLLGTFYRAPRPGAPPFVTVGSLVRPDTVVCIIETMKLMNSVTAGVSGTVAEILVANAQFAGQGTVLMRVREAR
jgi:acetyl-CoA carboxylase biotin carboxyl carrier protein